MITKRWLMVHGSSFSIIIQTIFEYNVKKYFFFMF